MVTIEEQRKRLGLDDCNIDIDKLDEYYWLKEDDNKRRTKESITYEDGKFSGMKIFGFDTNRFIDIKYEREDMRIIVLDKEFIKDTNKSIKSIKKQYDFNPETRLVEKITYFEDGEEQFYFQYKKNPNGVWLEIIVQQGEVLYVTPIEEFEVRSFDGCKFYPEDFFDEEEN